MLFQNTKLNCTLTSTPEQFSMANYCKNLLTVWTNLFFFQGKIGETVLLNHIEIAYTENKNNFVFFCFFVHCFYGINFSQTIFHTEKSIIKNFILFSQQNVSLLLLFKYIKGWVFFCNCISFNSILNNFHCWFSVKFSLCDDNNWFSYQSNYRSNYWKIRMFISRWLYWMREQNKYRLKISKKKKKCIQTMCKLQTTNWQRRTYHMT